MSYRPMKLHFLPADDSTRTLCGVGSGTRALDRVTCRICMFRYLAEQAPWARQFLTELRAAPPDAKTSEPRRVEALTAVIRGNHNQPCVCWVCSGKTPLNKDNSSL